MRSADSHRPPQNLLEARGAGGRQAIDCLSALLLEHRDSKDRPAVLDLDGDVSGDAGARPWLSSLLPRDALCAFALESEARGLMWQDLGLPRYL